MDRTTGIRSLDAILHHLTGNGLLHHRIVITGHSLGGALATIFAVKFRQRFPDAARDPLREIVTYGAPAVGAASFHDHYGDLHARTTRIVNGADAVPFTPPFGYRHVGRELWLGREGDTEEVGWPKRMMYALDLMELARLKRDHPIGAYIERMSSPATQRPS